MDVLPSCRRSGGEGRGPGVDDRLRHPRRRDRRGTERERRVPADAETLARVADLTGGTAYQAESVEQLRQVYDDIGSSIAWTTEARELAPYFAAGAFLFALVAAAFSLRWFARLI